MLASVGLRTRITIVVSSITLVAAALLGFVAYRNTASELVRQVDQSLVDAARQIAERPSTATLVSDQTRPAVRERIANSVDPTNPASSRPRQFEQVLVQVVDGDGDVVLEPSSGQLPTTDDVLELANAGPRNSREWLRWTVDSEQYRVLVSSLGSGDGAVVVARSLEETQATLRQLSRRSVVAGGLIVLLATGASVLIGAGVTRRLKRLSDDIGRIAHDPTAEMTYHPGGSDEVALVAETFGSTLAALRQSQAAQQQLLQDAGHELRTPLTSLRANAESLRRYDRLSAADREAVVSDMVSETAELSSLIDEIVEVLRDGPSDEAKQLVSLGDLAERVVARARRRSTAIEVTLASDESLVDGRPRGLERAISNLVDNAIKFGKPGDRIDVVVQHGTVSVRDQGPGIDPVDAPHVFGRFYRSDRARAVTGSGLGLSIVAEVVRQHGGQTFVQQPAQPPGVIVGFTVPTVNAPI